MNLRTSSQVQGEVRLVLEAVSRSFGSNLAVDAIDLKVAAGELVCLLGPSGCGKSTTLRIAAGLEDTQSGRVLLDGNVVADAKTFVPPEKRNVGFLFQDYALFPHLTVAKNIEFGLETLTPEKREERVMEVLTQVGMECAGHCYPHTLSGGQQQRAALARALAPNPSLMLLDEPFSGLDSRLRDQIRDETLHVLKNSGVATLMVTHDPEEAMFMADRIVLMNGGRIVQDGAPVDLYCQPVDAFTARFFGEVNRIDGVVKKGKVATPFGDVPAKSLADGASAQVLIRPEALDLGGIGSQRRRKAKAEVLAARMLGRASLVHMCMDWAGGEPLHLHARVPDRFLPNEGEMIDVRLDMDRTFVFANEE